MRLLEKKSRVVALRKERVDRNVNDDCTIQAASVALRKESVDRNHFHIAPGTSVFRSLSARRAWIEISGVDFAEDWLNVALRKESVDRNMSAFDVLAVSALSLSARRAWIEMSQCRL